MIAGHNPKLFAERLQHFSALFQAAAECRQVTDIDKQISRLSNNPFECRQIAVNIAKKQNSHGVSSLGDFSRAGCLRLMSCMNIPFCSQPSSTTASASSKTTR